MNNDRRYRDEHAMPPAWCPDQPVMAKPPTNDKPISELVSQTWDKLRSDLAAANARVAEMARPCEWKRDDDPDMSDVWSTACGQMHAFTNDGPAENHHRFCPYCGHPIKEMP